MNIKDGVLKILFILAIVIINGCSSAKLIPTGFASSSLPPLSPNQEVKIITELPAGYSKLIEIGIAVVSVPGGGIISDKTPKAIMKLQETARKYGGNCVLLKDDFKEGGYYSSFGYSQQVVKLQGKVYYIEL